MFPNSKEAATIVKAMSDRQRTEPGEALLTGGCEFAFRCSFTRF
jgi:hypothetical protein